MYYYQFFSLYLFSSWAYLPFWMLVEFIYYFRLAVCLLPLVFFCLQKMFQLCQHFLPHLSSPFHKNDSRSSSSTSGNRRWGCRLFEWVKITRHYQIKFGNESFIKICIVINVIRAGHCTIFIVIIQPFIVCVIVITYFQCFEQFIVGCIILTE